MKKIFIDFFALGVGFHLFPEINTLAHSDPAANQDHCGFKHGALEVSVHYQRANTSSKYQSITLIKM